MGFFCGMKTKGANCGGKIARILFAASVAAILSSPASADLRYTEEAELQSLILSEEPSAAAPGETSAIGDDSAKPHGFGLHLVKAARTQLGTPYRLGAHAPGRGFDCSGLVWWVYRQQGIDVPRDSRSQSRIGHQVDLAEAKAGDIVVFKTNRGPNGLHTGILTDSSHFIHAPRSGDRVKVSEISGYWAQHFYTVRHVGGLKLPKNAIADVEFADRDLEDALASADPLRNINFNPDSPALEYPPKEEGPAPVRATIRTASAHHHASRTKAKKGGASAKASKKSRVASAKGLKKAAQGKALKRVASATTRRGGRS
ncbi:MAG: C40 family peptidase [Sutterellaceae bacterium]|nr:C40 family peptidase [Sutterellaceae bacterium]